MPIFGRRTFMTGRVLVSDWDIPYQQVFYANTVLQGLAGIQTGFDGSGGMEYAERLGACFAGLLPFSISRNFLPSLYDSATAAKRSRDTDPAQPGYQCKDDPGEHAGQLCADPERSEVAEGLLPAAIPVNNLNRPSRAGGPGTFCTNLSECRRLYGCWEYADSVLQDYPYLLDYNSVPPGIIPICETIWPKSFTRVTSRNREMAICWKGSFAGCIIDTNLIASYAANDLRPSVYYFRKGSSYTLNGSYSGTVFPFSGLATDELYLIRAECSARAGANGRCAE